MQNVIYIHMYTTEKVRDAWIYKFWSNYMTRYAVMGNGMKFDMNFTWMYLTSMSPRHSFRLDDARKTCLSRVCSGKLFVINLQEYIAFKTYFCLSQYVVQIFHIFLFNNFNRLVSSVSWYKHQYIPTKWIFIIYYFIFNVSN